MESVRRPIVSLNNLSKRFASTMAVDGVDLDIASGEFFCLVGASGSGKTTLLRMIAGFEQPNAGRIVIDGADMTDVPAYRRPVNMMFQSYALFPHLSVAKNVAFGLEEERRPKAEIHSRVEAALAMLEMGGLGSRKPHQLSGGQRQRVALARALVKQPKILLLDEPLAALDQNLRERTQSELVNLRARVGITFIMVTHDQEEALSMATRIALMRDGRIVQVDDPKALYEMPNSRFAAEFFGATNVFEGRIMGVAGGYASLESADGGAVLHASCGDYSLLGKVVAVMVRPELVVVSRHMPMTDNVMRGTLRSLIFKGSFTLCHVFLESGKIVVARLLSTDAIAAALKADGDVVYVSWPRSAARVLVQ
jgi:putrescine transport system ATP-binding protein